MGIRLSPKMKFKVEFHFVFHVSNVAYWTETGELFYTLLPLSSHMILTITLLLPLSLGKLCLFCF